MSRSTEGGPSVRNTKLYCAGTTHVSYDTVMLSCDNGSRAVLKTVVQKCIGSSNLSLSVKVKHG